MSIHLSPITVYLYKKSAPLLLVSSFQEWENHSEVSLEPSLIQAKQSQLPQHFISRWGAPDLWWSLWLSSKCVPTALCPSCTEAPGLDATLQVAPHKGREEGYNHLLLFPATQPFFDAAQDTTGLSGCMRWLVSSFLFIGTCKSFLMKFLFLIQFLYATQRNWKI